MRVLSDKIEIKTNDYTVNRSKVDIFLDYG